MSIPTQSVLEKKQVGLKEDETSIVSNLPPAMLEEFTDILKVQVDSDDEDLLLIW